MLSVGKHRMEWLDALRGFTMILVVAYHVCLNGFHEDYKISSSMPLLVMFRMPLFFFISGFLAYKADMNWTTGRLGMMIWKKVKIQIIPTLVFMTVAMMILNKNFIDGFSNAMKSPTKGGYWFTWTLLLMFIIYYLFSFVEGQFKKKSWIPIAVLWFIALAVYASCYMPAWFDYAVRYKGKRNEFLDYTSLFQLMIYFHFFLYGNIVHRYWDKFQRLFDTSWFFPILVTVAFLSTMEALKWHNMRMQWTNLPRTVSMYSLMTIVFMFFRHYQDSFTKQHLVGRTLQYIGVRTLDIYLIHFILIPNMSFMGDFFKQYRNNFVIDTTLSIAVALIVIAFCVLISNILRISPFLKKYLFGRK